MHPKLQQLKIVGNSPNHSVLDKIWLTLFLIASVVLHFCFLSFLLLLTPSKPLSDSSALKNNIDISYSEGKFGDYANIADANFNHSVKKSQVSNRAEEKKELFSAPINFTDTYYYSASEIDEPATLVGELDLNIEAWPRGSVAKLRIRLFISENGSVSNWEILSKGNNIDNLSEGLAYLSNTIFNAAKLHEKPVNSIKDIEVVIFRD